MTSTRPTSPMQVLAGGVGTQERSQKPRPSHGIAMDSVGLGLWTWTGTLSSSLTGHVTL